LDGPGDPKEASDDGDDGDGATNFTKGIHTPPFLLLHHLRLPTGNQPAAAMIAQDGKHGRQAIT
jgi:hypothetical protein